MIVGLRVLIIEAEELEMETGLLEKQLETQDRIQECFGSKALSSVVVVGIWSDPLTIAEL